MGRQKPQCTQSPISAASGGWWSSNAPPGTGASGTGTVIQMPPAKRPGESRWSGSNWSLTRRIRSSAGTGPQTSTACLTAAGASTTTSEPPACGAGRPEPADGVVDLVDRDVGGQGGVQHAGAGGAADRRAGRTRRGEHVAEAGERAGQLERRLAVAPRVRRPALRGLLGHGGVGAEQVAHGARALLDRLGPAAQQDGDRAAAVGGEVDLDGARHGLGVDRGVRQPVGLRRRRATGAPTQRCASGTGCSRKIAEVMTAERAEGADHQLADVVAGDVLHHAAARLGDDAVGAHDGDRR